MNHFAHIAGDEINGDGDIGRGVAILPLMQDCLNNADLDLRCYAEECVVLIHGARLELGVGEDEAENTTQRRFRRGSWDGSEREREVLMDEVKQRVSELRTLSKTSDAFKAADRRMNRKRKSRINAQNRFLTIDGEGI